jgi:Endonuclease/Exonuclease/phosphatase family
MFAMKKILLGLIVLASINLIAQTPTLQKTNYKLAVVAFYNLENFYDTLDDPNTSDEEFTPKGERNYNSTIYLNKVEKLATCISKIGTDDDKYPCPDGAAFIGVAEIENDNVLNDLVHHPLIKNRNYKIVHYDCKDKRGVDVGLLYNPKYFKVLDSKSLFVNLPQGSKEAYYTRDVLWVKGEFDGEIVHVYVNHWPSRLGGEERSAPGRAAAAMVSKHHSDSIMKAEGVEQKVIVMGDLNDDPVSPSMTKVLKCKADVEDVKEGGLYNPWVKMYKNGMGTLGFQDAWGLFDQIVVGHKWLDKKQDGFFFQKQFIFNREFLTENLGRYKGYPMRTWDGLSYRGGYSDHYPTYLVMLKKVP